MTFDGSGTVFDGGSELVVQSVADGKEADRQLRRIARTRAGLDVEEARWLLIAREAEVHRQFGFATFLEYCERVLGHGPRAAVERLRVAEELEGLPVVKAALGRGEVSYSAVREITRIATEATEAAWVEAVRDRTMREIEPMVAGRKRGDLPGGPERPDLRLRTMRHDVTPETFAMYLEVQKRIGGQATDDEVMRELCRAYLGESEAPDEVPAPRYEVALTVCADCKRGWQDGGGRVLEVGPAAIERACCDAIDVGRVDGEVPTRARSRIPQATRKRVFARDHGRCVVPGCRSTRFLEVHHVVFQVHGGSHKMTNLAVLCGGHHDAVHDGRVMIARGAGGLVFKHADGRPWGAPPPHVGQGEGGAMTRPTRVS